MNAAVGAAGLGLRSKLSSGVRPAVGEGESGSLSSRGLDDPCTDALCPTADQHDLVVEQDHALLFPCPGADKHVTV